MKALMRRSGAAMSKLMGQNKAASRYEGNVTLGSDVEEEMRKAERKK